MGDDFIEQYRDFREAYRSELPSKEGMSEDDLRVEELRLVLGRRIGDRILDAKTLQVWAAEASSNASWYRDRGQSFMAIGYQVDAQNYAQAARALLGIEDPVSPRDGGFMTMSLPG